MHKLSFNFFLCVLFLPFTLIFGQKKNIEEFLKNKKAIIFGLPGAYTSVCSAKHLPGYVKMYDNYKNKGIDKSINSGNL